MLSIDDQLQSIGGDLLGTRVALDAEDHQSYSMIEAARLLAAAQTLIDQARALLKE